MMKHTARPTSLSAPGALHVTRRSMGVAGVLALSALAPAAAAQSLEESPTKANCAQAYESAQESRASGHLQETRRRLAFCARVECPSFVQKDCARWLEEVDRELPSIVISSAGLDPSEAAEVSVRLDGQIVARGLAGEPIAVDPGPHELVVEHPAHEPVRRAIVAQQGVQKRLIEVSFQGDPSVALAASPADMGAEAAPSLLPYAYAAWGVGALGLGVFAVLGTLGRADEDSLRQDCPVWTDDTNADGPGVCLRETFNERKADYEREFLIADIGLVTGIAGLAAGTVLFVMSKANESTPHAAEDEPGDLSLDVFPLRGGVGASLTGDF